VNNDRNKSTGDLSIFQFSWRYMPMIEEVITKAPHTAPIHDPTIRL